MPARAEKRLVDGPEEFRYLLGGEEVEGAAALEAPILVVGLEQGVVQAFDEWGRFDEWAAGTEVADEIEVTRKRLAAVQEREDSDTSWAERTSIRRVERVIENCEAFAEEIGVEVNSPEFLTRAIIDPDPLLGPIEGDLLDPFMLLWDNPCGGPSCYGSGAWRPIFGGIPAPDFRWFGYNDRASHVACSGIGVLTEHIWYRGRWAWMFGFPWVHFDLSMIGFDNIASAGWVS